MAYYFFHYPVTRPITLQHFRPAILLFGFFFVVLLTLVNVIAVGYENLSVISIAYNRTDTIWYEGVLETFGGFPKGWICSPSTIQVTEGSLAL